MQQKMAEIYTRGLCSSLQSTTIKPNLESAFNSLHSNFPLLISIIRSKNPHLKEWNCTQTSAEMCLEIRRVSEKNQQFCKKNEKFNLYIAEKCFFNSNISEK